MENAISNSISDSAIYPKVFRIDSETIVSENNNRKNFNHIDLISLSLRCNIISEPAIPENDFTDQRIVSSNQDSQFPEANF